jgi:DNA polymerase
VTDAGSIRDEIRRLARQARLLVAAEREAGVVCLPGVPRAAERVAAEPVAAEPGAPEPAPPTSAPAPATFVPRVGALDLAADAQAPFGDLPARVASCTACGLARARTRTVFGEGGPRARLVFCGEAPGYEEDRSGRPFVGRAGELLTAMIEKGMGLRREDVFILNTLKCRPPSNRAPTPEEHAACRPFLEEQLAVIRPDVIVALGNSACRALLGEARGISKLRGRVFEMFGAHVVPTYHPAYLLRQPEKKRDAWEDLKKVLRLLEDPEL